MRRRHILLRMKGPLWSQELSRWVSNTGLVEEKYLRLRTYLSPYLYHISKLGQVADMKLVYPSYRFKKLPMCTFLLDIISITISYWAKLTTQPQKEMLNNRDLVLCWSQDHSVYPWVFDGAKFKIVEKIVWWTRSIYFWPVPVHIASFEDRMRDQLNAGPFTAKETPLGGFVYEIPYQRRLASRMAFLINGLLPPPSPPDHTAPRKIKGIMDGNKEFHFASLRISDEGPGYGYPLLLSSCQTVLRWVKKRDNFLVMSQQRQNSSKENFGSSNARVLGRDFLYSLQVLF